MFCITVICESAATNMRHQYIGKLINNGVTQPPWWDYECCKLKKYKNHRLYQFHRSHNNVDLALYLQAKTRFRKVYQEKDYMLKLQLSLKNGLAVDCWSTMERFRSNTQPVSSPISPETWIKHFSALLNKHPATPEEFNLVVKQCIHDQDDNAQGIECINEDISVDEVYNTINKLPNAKSPELKDCV
jgi:hypothetical protein